MYVFFGNKSHTGDKLKISPVFNDVKQNGLVFGPYLSGHPVTLCHVSRFCCRNRKLRQVFNKSLKFMSRIPKCVASVKRLFLFTELSEIAPIYRTEKKLNGSDVQLWFVQVRVVHGLGQPTGWVGLSLVGLGWVDIFF